ncbi:MAG: helix-turn-helix domain-containing protein [Candidatus Faecivicinus sp.]|nr:helix-turn-helix domain-containing protein [Candidatus Faecivicinus sp.]
MTKYRLLIVDDEELIRKGLRARIDYFQFPDLEIAEAGSGREALEMLKQTEFAIALVDICMPDMNGLEMIEQVRAIRPRTQFLLLSGFAEFSYAQQAIRLGVRVYLNKPVSNEQLKENIEGVLQELRAVSSDTGRNHTAPDCEKELNILCSGSQYDVHPENVYPGLFTQCRGLFSGAQPFYLAILHIGRRSSEDAQLTDAQLNAIRPATPELFAGAPCESLIVNSYQNPRQMYALFWGEGTADRLKHRVEQAFFTACRRFETKFSARISMGVSRLTAARGPECVSEARVALRQRRMYGGNIYFYEDIAAYDPQSFPEAELELLRKHMARGDRIAIRHQLERLFSEKQLEGRKAVYLNVMWVRVISLMMSVFGSLDSSTVNRLLTQISRMEGAADQGTIVQTLMELTDFCLNRENGREMSTDEKVAYALDYIREHFNERIVINDLAAHLDMSPSYFSSIFKEKVGQSTMQYITGLRMERAREYLESTDQSVAVIAQDVGYEDIQYFFRVFKKNAGITPLQYRQQFKEN